MNFWWRPDPPAWSVPLQAYMGMAIMAPRKEGDLLFAGGVFDKAVVVRLDKDGPRAEVVWVEGQAKKGDGKEEPKKPGKSARGLQHPASRREHGQTNRCEKEQLREGRMRCRNGQRQIHLHGQAAEQALRDHTAKRYPA